MSELSWLEPQDFVRLDGLPFAEGPTDWHVNESMMAGSISLGDLFGIWSPLASTRPVKGRTPCRL